MQQAMDQGIAMVEMKIATRPQIEAQAPTPEPEDDGHEETVEEVRAKMKLAQEQMNADIQATDQRAAQSAAEMSSMPDMGALTSITSTIHSMSSSQAQRQVNLLAARLGVQPQAGDEKLAPDELSAVMIKRAQLAGKTEQEIAEGLQEP